MECKYCKTNFSSKTNLNAHQKRAKYCLKLQGKEPNFVFSCTKCEKRFPTSNGLKRHENICVENKVLLKKYNFLIKENSELKNRNMILEKEVENYKKLEKQIENLQKSLTECALEAIKNQKDESEAKKLRIKYLENKYLKKQRRIEYKERNVVYIVTTPSLKKECRYILGKATNLTNRLSTYNKTDEHEVVFYISCGDKNKMSLVESLSFNKLEKYREKANRERFILPEDKEICLFSNTIRDCLNFVN